MGKHLFDVAVVRLTEASVQLPPNYETGIVGYRDGWKLWRRGWQGVQTESKYFEINDFFEVFTVVICFPYI